MTSMADCVTHAKRCWQQPLSAVLALFVLLVSFSMTYKVRVKFRDMVKVRISRRGFSETARPVPVEWAQHLLLSSQS